MSTHSRKFSGRPESRMCRHIQDIDFWIFKAYIMCIHMCLLCVDLKIVCAKTCFTKNFDFENIQHVSTYGSNVATHTKKNVIFQNLFQVCRLESSKIILFA